MPLSKEHKQKTRANILAAAGILFREHGFEGVGIDDIMAKAGMTRGGFYAHFKSKADLFAKVLALEPSFTRMLAERQTATRDGSLQGALDVIATYLDPDNITHVTSTCPMVSLARDVDKAGLEGRAALTKVISDLSALLKSGMSGAESAERDGRAFAVLALCFGGVTMARTATDPAIAAKILNACETETQRLLRANL
jgi:TetR/AcrR family transcriptional repressor of nem operon